LAWQEEHHEELLPTVGTADTGKTEARFAAVEIALAWSAVFATFGCIRKRSIFAPSHPIAVFSRDWRICG
jgi:hypothetical protein